MNCKIIIDGCQTSHSPISALYAAASIRLVIASILFTVILIIQPSSYGLVFMSSGVSSNSSLTSVISPAMEQKLARQFDRLYPQTPPYRQLPFRSQAVQCDNICKSIWSVIGNSNCYSISFTLSYHVLWCSTNLLGPHSYYRLKQCRHRGFLNIRNKTTLVH